MFAKERIYESLVHKVLTVYQYLGYAYSHQ